MPFNLTNPELNEPSKEMPGMEMKPGQIQPNPDESIATNEEIGTALDEMQAQDLIAAIAETLHKDEQDATTLELQALSDAEDAMDKALDELGGLTEEQLDILQHETVAQTVAAVIDGNASPIHKEPVELTAKDIFGDDPEFASLYDDDEQI